MSELIDPTIELSVSDLRNEVIVDDTKVHVVDVTTEPRNKVIVDDDRIMVVSVGIQGPPGQAQGVEAPLQVDPDTEVLKIAPGTINGQGLIWNGTMWVQQQVVPSGSNGTVPFKAGSAFAGDGTDFNYDSTAKALSVPFLNNTVIDGGNF